MVREKIKSLFSTYIVTKLTLLPTAFYNFLSYWGGDFYPIPQKTMLRLFDSFEIWYTELMTFKNAKFYKICCSILEIRCHKVRLFTRERFIVFRYLPWNSYLMMPKSLFLKVMPKSLFLNGFSDLTIISLHISAIFNENKNFL